MSRDNWRSAMKDFIGENQHFELPIANFCAAHKIMILHDHIEVHP